jgi:hypothetical protein
MAMKKLKSNQKGQVIIESILLLVVFMSLWVYFAKLFNNSNLMRSLMADGPWPRLSGMIESGVWETPSKAKTLHPNNLDRGASKKE